MHISIYRAERTQQAELSARSLRPQKSAEARGNYDRVDLSGAAPPRPAEGAARDESFARVLAKKAAGEVMAFCVPEEQADALARQVSQGLYQPDPWTVAGRMLGIR